MNKVKIAVLSLLVLLVAGCQPGPPDFALVISGGRVIDPESGLDGVRNIGISDGTVQQMSEQALNGIVTIDATGLVVSPGFINVHSHSWTPLGQDFEALDGVTTALELESGAFPVAGFGTREPFAVAARPRINYGASTGHAWVRSAILDGDAAATGLDDLLISAIKTGKGGDMERASFRRSMTAGQRDEMTALLRDGLDEGGLGIGVLLDYMSEFVDDAEIRAVFDVAGERDAPVIVHVRRGMAGDTAGLIEMIELARSSGAPVHICHLNASAMGGVEEWLRLIRGAREDGIRITTESFPYNAGSTGITAAVFNRDWKTILGISYEDIEWAATGERFTEEMWNEYREKHPAGTVIHHSYKEEWGRIAIAAPDVMVAADGFPIFTLERKVGPYGIGTNARILGRYVREQGLLGLADALAKMTYLPAQMLENYSPVMARKGRLRVGADADITVFDPASISDNATFGDPYNASTGIIYVVVNGEIIVDGGELRQNAYPGRRILRNTTRQ